MEAVSISIIVPIYQVEKYIRRCIRSIREQTIKCFELLLVDDGTLDRSIEIAENELQGFHIDYRVIRKTNGGLASARNAGIREAKGEWVVFVDSDDELKPFYLECLLTGCLKYNSDISIGVHERIVQGDQVKYNDSDVCDYVCLSSNELCERFLLRQIQAHPCTVLYRRSFLIENNLFFNEKVLFSEDQEFHWNVFPKVRNACFTKTHIYNYYIRSGSITTSPQIEKILTGYNGIGNRAKDLQSVFTLYGYIVPRWVFGVLHDTAKHCGYSQFKEIASKLDYRKNLRLCGKRFGYKTMLAAWLCAAFLRAGYSIFRIE